jgi:Flp pilus assembly pilin Flp
MSFFSQKGQGLVEYALLIIILLAFVAASVTPLANAIKGSYGTATNTVNNANAAG